MIIFAFCAGIEPFKTVSPQQNMKLKLWSLHFCPYLLKIQKNHTFKT